jgi:purine nucleoside permease
MKRTLASLAALLALSTAAPALAALPAKPIEVRVVLCTTWEWEPDGKDVMGELQHWRQRWPLPVTLPFPAGNHTLHYDPKTHVLAVVTGMTTTRAAASVMALGLDPRFDLSHAYWLVPGSAGVDPKVGSTGSAVWVRWAVDGDMGTEIDLRDAPADWPTGVLPKERTAPYQLPAPPIHSIEANMAFQLNRSLVDWAYHLTRDVKLMDSDELASRRKLYSGEGARPPFVFEGATLTSVRFYFGTHHNDHARRWVDYWTGGQDVYAMSNEEDSAIVATLNQLAGTGRVDANRVLVLRAADNYTIPPPGMTAIEQLDSSAKAGPPGVPEALENLYRTGSPVVRYLVDHWATTRDTVPGK